MNSDPIWFYFVVPLILIALQLATLAIVYKYATRVKEWFAQVNNLDDTGYTLPTANEARAKHQQRCKDRVLHTKSKLLNLGSKSDKENF